MLSLLWAGESGRKCEMGSQCKEAEPERIQTEHTGSPAPMLPISGRRSCLTPSLAEMQLMLQACPRSRLSQLF